jgi:hypothetical protein
MKTSNNSRDPREGRAGTARRRRQRKVAFKKPMIANIAEKPPEVSDKQWAAFLKATADCTMEWVLGTPAMCQEWMKLNDRNRKLSANTISYYADQVKTGDWLANGQTIIFGKNGRVQPVEIQPDIGVHD